MHNSLLLNLGQVVRTQGTLPYLLFDFITEMTELTVHGIINIKVYIEVKVGSDTTDRPIGTVKPWFNLAVRPPLGFPAVHRKTEYRHIVKKYRISRHFASRQCEIPKYINSFPVYSGISVYNFKRWKP